MLATTSASVTRGLRRTIVPAFTAAAALAVGLLAPGAAHAMPRTPAPQFWSPNGNESLLLDADDTATITRTPGLRVTGVSSQFVDSAKRVDPANCVVAFQPAERSVYPDSTNATTVVIDDGTRSRDATRLVQQSVIGFPDATTAQRGFDSASAAWRQCGAQTVTVKTRSGRAAPWVMGIPAPRRGGTVLTATNLGPSVNCERALSARNEVIVDVRVCALGTGDAVGQAETIAAAVADNVANRAG